MREQDREFYSSNVNYFDSDQKVVFQKHADTVAQYVDAVMPRFQEAAAKHSPLRILELGAGICLTSLLIRKQIPQAQFTCLDISLTRMQKLIGPAAKWVGVDESGVELIESDFTHRLPFGDQQFDVIVFDAALHHSRSIWTTLEECYRVLSPDGAIAALREQYLAPLTSWYAIKRLLNTPEFKAGVAENAFLKEQYDYYFRAAGFEPKFHAVNPGKWRLLAPLNGLVFSKWSVWASKVPKTRSLGENVAKAEV